VFCVGVLHCLGRLCCCVFVLPPWLFHKQHQIVHRCVCFELAHTRFDLVCCLLFVARGSLLFCFSPACEPADNTQVSEAARLAQLDMDTVMSRESYEAAMYAAGKCKVLPRLQRTSTGGILNSACPFICLSFSHSFIIFVLSFFHSFVLPFSPSFPFSPSPSFFPLLSPSLPFSPLV
jgi:hypothetical protein